MPRMRASVDIGTNTALLLVALFDGKSMQVIEQGQRTPRIGKGVDESGLLRQDRVDRLISDLLDYRQITDKYGIPASEVVVTATSAMRDAANRGEVMGRIRHETGYTVRLLSGEEEAVMTWQGALHGLETGTGDLLVVDVGGGSTELAIGTADRGLLWTASLHMGSVRATERYLRSPLPSFGEAKDLQSELKRLLLAARTPALPGLRAIAVAGTAATAAAMYLNPDPSRYADLHGQCLSMRDLVSLIGEVCALRAEERLLRWPAWLEGRADIIPAGLIVLHEVLDWFGVVEFCVSLGGIRYGALLE